MSMTYCFFYIIETAHYVKYDNGFVQLLGYGITISPIRRSKQYSDHSGTEQEFCNLFFGPILHVKALESIIKQRLASKRHKIYGEPVEWVSPKHKMSSKELLVLVKDTIAQEGFNIRAITDDYLPFNNLDHHRKITVKELHSNPELYLEEINLTFNRT